MSLDTFNVTRVNQRAQTTNPSGDPDAIDLIKEEYSGMVDQVIRSQSVMTPFIPVRRVTGTSTVTNYAVGRVSLQVLVPGVTPNGTPGDFDKASLVIDTVILARNIVPILDDLQNAFGARQELANAQGGEFAEFQDQAFLIQATKAALSSTPRYGLNGYDGGTQVEIAEEDRRDPAAIYAAIVDLFAEMEEKKVSPQRDKLILALRPRTFYDFVQAEQVINGEYITAEGNRVQGTVFKAFGVPVVSTTNLPAGEVIENHPLNGPQTPGAYDGDFTNVVAVAFSPKALLAGETISRQTKIFFDDVSKHWYIDTWQSFGVTTNRTEYAGAVVVAGDEGP